ncbi:MAG: tetratricopeptide repeat protein, partial [Promethearchaeota archaeon]
MKSNNLLEPLPKELTLANKLMYEGKFDKALETLVNFDEKETSTSKSKLSGFNLKGRIYCYRGEYRNALEIGEIAYILSQKLGYDFESIDALIIKAHVIYLGKTEEAYEIIIKAEKIFKSISDFPTSGFTRQQADILLLKSIILSHRDDHNRAMELAMQCLPLLEEINEKLDLSRILYHLSELYLHKSEPKLGLEYALKSLVLREELNYQSGIAESLYLVGTGYYTTGDFDQALKLAKQSLTINEISFLTRLEILDLLAVIHTSKGELDKAIRYRNKVDKLAKKESFNEQVIINTYGIGVIYRTRGQLNQAMEYFKDSLKLSEKFGSIYGTQTSLFYLIITNLDNNSLDQAKQYLEQLEQ